MTAIDVVERARTEGLTLLSDGDMLVVRPAKLLTEALAADLQAHKQEILALLSAPPALEAERAKRSAWQRAAFELAEMAGWPRLHFKPGHAVAPGEYCWRMFVTSHGLPDLQRVVASLREYLQSIPLPGERPPTADEEDNRP